MPETLLLKQVAMIPTTLLKKRLWHRCYPVNFAKFLRTSFLQNFSARLLSTLLTKVFFRFYFYFKFYVQREPVTFVQVMMFLHMVQTLIFI